MIPVVHEFSAGYYLVEGLYVEPNDETEVPLIQSDVYAHMRDEYYEGRQKAMLFRHNRAQYHFQVHPSNNVRANTIEMPFELVDDMGIDRFSTEEQFLLAKPRQSHNIYRLSDPDKTVIEG